MQKQDIACALSRYRVQTQSQGQVFRAVFFDMDGVLFDSMPAHSRSWCETALHYGLEMTPEDAYRYEGQTGKHTIDLLYRSRYGRPATEAEAEAVYAHKTDLFVRYNSGAVISGAPEVVERLRSLKRLLVTGSSQRSLLEKIEPDFPGVFTAERMITGRDVRRGKPDPEPYLMAIQRAEVAPSEAMVVENAPQGVRSASAAGCFTIAVNTGPLPDEALWCEGAHLVLPSMASLLEAIPLLLENPSPPTP